MRIFSKKAFAIGPGAQRGTTDIDLFTTVPGAFQEMPDKYKNDPTFLLALKAGDITIVDSKAAELAAQEGENLIDDKAHQTALQAFYEELKLMNKEETFALAEKYGVAPKNGEQLKNLKKRVFEAYKLANPEEVEEADKGQDDENTEE